MKHSKKINAMLTAFCLISFHIQYKYIANFFIILKYVEKHQQNFLTDIYDIYIYYICMYAYLMIIKPCLSYGGWCGPGKFNNTAINISLSNQKFLIVSCD